LQKKPVSKNLVTAMMRGLKKVKESAKTDSLNRGKSLSKNGIPVAFLVEKTDYNN